MQFAIMRWLNNGASVGSIYGVLDADNPSGGLLPRLSKDGIWADVRKQDESEAAYAEDAKQSIAEHGYYLVAGWAVAAKC